MRERKSKLRDDGSDRTAFGQSILETANQCVVSSEMLGLARIVYNKECVDDSSDGPQPCVSARSHLVDYVHGKHLCYSASNLEIEVRADCILKYVIGKPRRNTVDRLQE